jgi:hypothetical protein
MYVYCCYYSYAEFERNIDSSGGGGGCRTTYHLHIIYTLLLLLLCDGVIFDFPINNIIIK